jgi:hypothetical protein
LVLEDLVAAEDPTKTWYLLVSVSVSVLVLVLVST